MRLHCLVLSAGLICLGAAPATADDRGGHEAAAPAHDGAHAPGAQDSHDSGHGSEGAINWLSFDYSPKDASPNPPLLLAIINFMMLLGILGWKAVPAIRSYMVSKQDGIKSGLEEGARLQKEAAQKADEYDRRIANVDKEVDLLVTDIRAEAEEERKRILAEAERQAAALEKATEGRIAAALSRARVEIEREVVSAAVAAAENLLRENASATDQQALIASFIDSLPAEGKAQSGGPS